MSLRKVIAVVFMGIAFIFSVFFYLETNRPEDFAEYFNLSFYTQYGPVAISIELFIAGFYLFKASKKANFALALFGFTTVIDILFHITSLITSNTPLYAMFVFSGCAIGAFYISFSNAFNLGKITLLATLTSFVMGNAIEWFFNFY
ncbi:hypothetical protein [Croceitalea rosinachiae]|uniref:Uncharacterized protein n=1 Tax=Croceitalea rosinachiae TaxID=3075596 RepID=A0ABU3ADT2_9FLAO|nr:hypothetical protein [Croceitalea sp. F388]MDT0607051.1 hypothetical protein [Croceitalea sp. F388]